MAQILKNQIQSPPAKTSKSKPTIEAITIPENVQESITKFILKIESYVLNVFSCSPSVNKTPSKDSKDIPAVKIFMKKLEKIIWSFCLLEQKEVQTIDTVLIFWKSMEFYKLKLNQHMVDFSSSPSFFNL